MSTITLASERAAAPTGCMYIAPLMVYNWFRCDMTSRAGCYKLGRDVAGLKSVPIQIFADGEWHTVLRWDANECCPVQLHIPELNEEEEA